MHRLNSKNRRGLALGILCVLIALGTGHLMQSGAAADITGEAETPAIPKEPEAVLAPVVLLTPEPRAVPDSFG